MRNPEIGGELAPPGLPLKLGAEGDDSWIVELWLCLYLPPDTGVRLGTLFRDTGTLCANVRGTLERPLVEREGEREAAVAAVRSQTRLLDPGWSSSFHCEFL